MESGMETEKILVREAGEDDVYILYDMIKGLALHEKRPFDVTGSVDMLKNWLFYRHIATALIAESDGITIGYAIYYPVFASFSANGNVHLEDFFIKKEYRKMGYGMKFFECIVDRVLKEGYSKIEWSCLDWNESAISFYEKIGAVYENGRKYFEYTVNI